MDENFDLLGSFYLGKNFDFEKQEIEPLKYLYESKDLQTHAAILGMTGSGKTGLGITLLEEAGLDGIPSIVIDPKGDMGNLCLNFPQFKDEDFLPWVSEAEATEKKLSKKDLAQKEAKKWKKGIESWDQNSQRLKNLKQKVDINLFTPGADYGIPVSILSFLKSPQGLKKTQINERASMAASSLLSLLGNQENPLNSTEHVFLSNIFQKKWSQGESLSIEALIKNIKEPPFQKLGVLNLEEFISQKERNKLALQLNNLIASPRFQAWLNGASLNVEELLFGKKGKAQISIFCIAHLNDQERIFFVSLLLNEIISWMRQQKGSKALRALLYMDEIFGYLPPNKNPSTKEALLTLLKQARAFGLGLVLSTQNPIDLDYKALSNMGTWFIGRLQTEQDKNRIIEGLKVGLDKKELAELKESISNLAGRVFVAKNVHEKSGLKNFHVRWAMSYLKGPLDQEEIKQLCSDRKKVFLKNSPQKDKTTRSLPQSENIPSEDIEQLYAEVRAQSEDPLVYAPSLMSEAQINFDNSKLKIKGHSTLRYIIRPKRKSIQLNWSKATPLPEVSFSEKANSPNHLPAPKEMFRSKWFTEAEKEFIHWIYHNFEKNIYYAPEFKEYSQLNESENAFRDRLSGLTRQLRDSEKAKIKKSYEKKFKSLESKIQSAYEKVERETAQAKSAKMDTFISIGATVLGALLGKKTVSVTNARRSASTLKSGSRAYQQSKDVDIAQRKLELLKEDLIAMEDQLKSDLKDIETSIDPAKTQLETTPVKIYKKNITVKKNCLLWLPYFRISDFEMEKAWE